MTQWTPTPTLARRALGAACLLAAVTAAGCEDDATGPTGPFGRAIYAVDDANRLVRFGSTRPDQVTSGAITGLQAGETVVGIDFRAVDRRLYAVGSSSRIYTVDTVTAVATPIGSAAFTPALSGAAFGVDFNPVPDRVRVHTDAEQNLRLNQLTGATAAVDGALAYAAGDAGAGSNPAIAGTAYTNSVAPAPATTVLFAIDAARDVLVTLANPNDGQMRTVGPLGVATTDRVGFDIVGSDGTAYATLTETGASRSRLYTVNTGTGAVTEVGVVRHGSPLRGIAVAP
ncbi:MAG TPA: DUF4394 domain-containing protein [Longimicrobiaceae bacterium]|jgi:hypothetical protein